MFLVGFVFGGDEGLLGSIGVMFLVFFVLILGCVFLGNILKVVRYLINKIFRFYE